MDVTKESSLPTRAIESTRSRFVEITKRPFAFGKFFVYFSMVIESKESKRITYKCTIS